jgi:hypothetical protein
MEIGEPRREIVIEPIEDPVPREQPVEPGPAEPVPVEPDEIPA